MKTNKLEQCIEYAKTNPFSIIGWGIVFALSLYFVNSNAIRYFNPSYEIYTPAFRPFAPFIVVHVAGGVIALLIGPFQFFPFIRKKYVRFHRTIGKIYLISVLTSVIAATYLAIFHNLFTKREFMFGTGTFAMASAWLITGSMAFWAIKKRNFIQHKEWMIRSYVLTCNFIIFRLIFYGLLGVESFPFKDDVGGFTARAGWSLPLLITEFILQARKISAATN